MVHPFKHLIIEMKLVPSSEIIKMKTSIITLFLMTMISTLLFKLGKPYERGFYCSDQSILKPYYPITIRMPYLLFFSLLIPIIFIITIELSYKSNGNTIISKIKQMYFGIVLTFIMVLVSKVYFGRLRPNSIRGMCNATHYCQPDTEFVPEFVCNNPVPKLVREARMSFYSGHSSVGTYAAFYIILYIYYRFRSQTKSLILIQLLVLLIGLIPGFTQGINYWHHWSDIGTGYIVGAITAYLVINYV